MRITPTCGDGVERGDQLGQAPRRQHQRIAAGQDHLPDLAVAADIGERRVELGRRQRLAARARPSRGGSRSGNRPGRHAAASAARGRDSGARCPSPASAPRRRSDRRAPRATISVSAALGHELAGDRIARGSPRSISASHLGRDGDRHGLRQPPPAAGRASRSPSRSRASSVRSVCMAALKYSETRLPTSSENHHHSGRKAANEGWGGYGWRRDGVPCSASSSASCCS